MSNESVQVADAIARVCADMSNIRARLDRGGDTSALDELVAAMRSGAEVTGELEALHAALQQCGDALGVFPPVSRGRNVHGIRPVGLGNSRPAEVVFLCPYGMCSRAWRPDPSAPLSTLPECQLHGKPLRWERL